MCEHPMCEHMWPLYVSRMCGEHDVWALNVWALYVSTSTEKHENYQENSTSVLGPDVAAPKTSNKHEFYCKKPFKSIAEHRKVRELQRKLNIEEVEEPETTKIYRQNPFTPAAAKPKLRKFTDETNMQARNHENSDEFRPAPVRHLDLDTPAFYPYRKNPKCYHTVWGTTL